MRRILVKYRRTVHNQQIRDPNTRMIPLTAYLDNYSDSHFISKMTDAAVRKIKESYFINVFKLKLNKH